MEKSPNQIPKLTTAFTMDAGTAMEFYRRCMERKAMIELEKHNILMEMVHEGLIKNVVVTKKSKEEYIKHLSKHFNVLDSRKEDKK